MGGGEGGEQQCKGGGKGGYQVAGAVKGKHSL